MCQLCGIPAKLSDDFKKYFGLPLDVDYYTCGDSTSLHVHSLMSVNKTVNYYTRELPLLERSKDIPYKLTFNKELTDKYETLIMVRSPGTTTWLELDEYRNYRYTKFSENGEESTFEEYFVRLFPEKNNPTDRQELEQKWLDR